jgi:hypothetical protein
MPISHKFNCGCGFKCEEESHAVDHAKETGHEVHGITKIITQSAVQRQESSPVHGHFESGRFVPDKRGI